MLCTHTSTRAVHIEWVPCCVVVIGYRILMHWIVHLASTVHVLYIVYSLQECVTDCVHVCNMPVTHLFVACLSCHICPLLVTCHTCVTCWSHDIPLSHACLTHVHLGKVKVQQDTELHLLLSDGPVDVRMHQWRTGHMHGQCLPLQVWSLYLCTRTGLKLHYYLKRKEASTFILLFKVLYTVKMKVS